MEPTNILVPIKYVLPILVVEAIVFIIMLIETIRSLRIEPTKKKTNKNKEKIIFKRNQNYPFDDGEDIHYPEGF